MNTGSNPSRQSMTPRQRWYAALDFAHPDKIPLYYHTSPAGLHVLGQKLADLFNQYPPDNPITFDAIPHPPPETIDASGRYEERRTDEWGTTWEWLTFGLYGHPIGFPFKDWVEARSYRFPAPPWEDPADFERQKQLAAQQKQTYFTFYGGASLFEKSFALCPMDKLLMDMADEDPDMLRFLDRMVDYWAVIIDRALALDYDGVMFSDDWGTQRAPLLSLKLFRKIIKPRYQVLMEPVRKAGKKILFHSCGRLGVLFDELLDLGIDVYWPQIKLFEQDNLPSKCVEHQVTIYIHPDRQYLVPHGTPREIDDAIRGYADYYHKQGGGAIFYVEIENGHPFENVRALVEAIDRYR